MPVFNKKRYSCYSELINEHIDKLYSVAYRFTNNKPDAEDLVQDVVLKLQPKFKELQALDKPQVWMTKVLYHVFVDKYRRKARSPISLVSDIDSDQSNIEYLEQFPSNQACPVASVERGELISQLDLALKQLSEQDRMMIVLYEIEGYSIRELQEVVDMPTGSVKSRLSRARKRLRELMKSATEYDLNRVNG